MKKNKGFTLAEVLIALVIIGIIAAITIPPLYSNYQKRVYVEQLRKAYSQAQQAFDSIMSDSNAVQLNETGLYGNFSTMEEMSSKIEEIMQKYFSIVKSCKNSSSDCEIKGYKYLGGQPMGGNRFGLGTHYSFYTTDGFAYEFALSDVTGCQPNNSIEGDMKAECGNIGIDINAKKGPNQFGRDYFVFLISQDGTLYPLNGQAHKDFGGAYWQDNHTYCGAGMTSLEFGIEGLGCAARIMEENWKMDY